MSYFDRLEGIRNNLITQQENAQSLADQIQQGAEELITSKLTDIGEKMESIGGLGLGAIKAGQAVNKLWGKWRGKKDKKDDEDEEQEDPEAETNEPADAEPDATTPEETSTATEEATQAQENTGLEVGEDVDEMGEEGVDMVSEYANALANPDISDTTRAYLEQSQQEAQVPDPEADVSELPQEVELTTFNEEATETTAGPLQGGEVSAQDLMLDADPEADFISAVNPMTTLETPAIETGGLMGDSTIARALGNGLEDPMNTVGDLIPAEASEALTGATDAVSGAMNTATSIADNITSTATDTISGLADTATDLTATATDALSSATSGLSSLAETGLAIGEGVLDAIPVVGEVAMVGTLIAGFFETLFGGKDAEHQKENLPGESIVSSVGYDPSSLIKGVSGLAPTV